MQADVASTVRRAIQVTVAGKITAAMAARVPPLPARVAVSVGAAVLAVGACRLSPACGALADLALAVATSTLLQAVLVPGGASLALGLAHCCMVLEVGQALPLGHLAEAFLGNTQFLFAQSVGGLLVATLAPVLAFIGACALAGCAHWWASRDSMLSTALTQAAVFVLRTMLVRAIPLTLQLPTVAALLCFSSQMRLLPVRGFAEPLYTFALYQAGETLNASLQAACGPLVATLAALTLALALAGAPTLALPGTAAQMAAVSAATDLAMHTVAPAADTDPLLCLLPVLVFTVVLEAAVPAQKNSAKPPGPPAGPPPA